MIFFNHGSGANGKSTILNAVRHSLGPYAHAADIELFLHTKSHGKAGHNEATANLRGARFVLASEPGEGRQWSERLLKELSGGESITASRKFEHEITFQPTFALWFSGNTQPTIRDSTDGTWRRMRLIPWPVKIPDSEVDSTLPAQLDLEAPGIIAWLVRGCLEWQQEGLGEPQEVVEATRSYRAENDHVRRFIEECLVADPSASVVSARVFADYTSWCRDAGEAPISRKPLTQKILEQIPGARLKRGNRTRMIAGVRMIEDSLPKPLFGDA